MATIGFYAGSFDPVTFGHTDIVERSLALVDELVVGIGIHHGKSPLFTGAERVAMLEEETRPFAEKHDRPIRIVTFDTLVVTAARAQGASLIIRGIRDTTDFDYEMQMAGMNGAMAPDLETVFLPASSGVRHIAASLVRQIAVMGGDVSHFVSAPVAKALAAKAGS